jgi:hypothetical protein
MTCSLSLDSLQNLGLRCALEDDCLLLERERNWRWRHMSEVFVRLRYEWTLRFEGWMI